MVTIIFSTISKQTTVLYPPTTFPCYVTCVSHLDRLYSQINRLYLIAASQFDSPVPSFRFSTIATLRQCAPNP